MTQSTTINWEQGPDGIVVLTFDDPDRTTNTMNSAYVASMAATIERLELECAQITGVVLTSAKRSFFAGADLKELARASPENLDELAASMREIKAQLRRLETFGRPVVAAINGAALGGGLEIALATHHRVALAAPGVEIGLPEVTLGLLPGVGGTVRTVRMLGVVGALSEILLRGPRLNAADAKRVGVVDELCETAAELVPTAKQWIAENPQAAQPWDMDGYRLPGGKPGDPELAAILPSLPANLRKRLRGADYPAPRNIVCAAVEGAQVDFAAAQEIESRYFLDLALGQIAKNMIQGNFFDRQRVSGRRGRPEHVKLFSASKVVVVGAGMMGSAIAYLSARAGIEVVLIDVSRSAAERGKDYSRRQIEQAVSRGRVTQSEADALLGRIAPADDLAAAAGADVVIEAVVEDPSVKAEVFAGLEPYLGDCVLLASNTSTLPITNLARGLSRPTDFIGLHFFSPAETMPLLEIIRGEQTSTASLHRSLDLAKQLGKVPIVVNDSRGFFTSRVIATFINEGVGMLYEGVPAPSIEQASAQAGYPVPVLQLSDELNLALLRRIRNEHLAATQSDGAAVVAHPADVVIDKMLDVFGRSGRRDGAGFYDYADGVRTRLWPGLRDLAPARRDPPFNDLRERMLFIEALEAIKCLEEGVVETVADANVGSILGIGFPAWTGGVLQYVNGYAGGLAGFVARATELSAAYGSRFQPPPSLLDRVARAEAYRDS